MPTLQPDLTLAVFFPDRFDFWTIICDHYAVDVPFTEDLKIAKSHHAQPQEWRTPHVGAGVSSHDRPPTGMRIVQQIGGQVRHARLSYEKLYDLLAAPLVKATDLAGIVAFAPDPRHVIRDRRSRQSPVESGILALTRRE